ncbi:MAG: shikimate dehydrogenase [Thermodesulfobacteriota bacterium]
MTLNARTELYGIIGNPVSHSLSPAMHNAAFAALKLNKAYAAFPVTDVAAALAGLKALGIRGASVTIPHKQAVIPYLDTIDPVAEKIGAVNTLVIRDNALHGLNTDWIGANRALTRVMPLKSSHLLLLGAGGSARAIGFGLIEAGATVTVANRTAEKAAALAAALGCPWVPIEAAATLKADGLINATSAGMAPHADQLPLPAEAITNFRVVMDIVYAPLETKLLATARAAGRIPVDGLEMLLYQGAAQFEVWTGLSAPLEIMRQTLLANLPKP